MSKNIENDADIMDSEEEIPTNNAGSDISQETNKENLNNNLSDNNTNTGQANNTTPTNTDIESSTETKNDMPVGGNTENIGKTDKAEGGSNIGIPTIDMGTPYGSYSVTLYPPTNNFSDYEITDYNYSDNTVHSDNEGKIKGTLSVTVKCTSDTPYITVKYVVKDSNGSAITNGEYVKCKGLDETKMYYCEEMNTSYSGGVLATIGIPLPVVDGEYNAFQFHFRQE